jgi:O-antigen/teichoic acid export membrane protein
LTEGVSLVAFPAAVGLALVADDFVHVVLSSKWEGAIVPLRLLAIYTSVRTISPILAPVLTALGDTRFMLWTNLLSLVLLPTSFLIGTHWGVGGVAAAWLTVHPLTLVLVYRRTFSKIQLSWAAYLKALWPALSGVAGLCLLVFGVRVLLPTGLPRPLHFGAEVAAGVVGYAGVLLLLHRGRLTRLRTVLARARSKPA